MCEDCEEAEPLREVYLARRARMARTWTPRRQWTVAAAPPPAISAMPQTDDEPELIAAQ